MEVEIKYKHPVNYIIKQWRQIVYIITTLFLYNPTIKIIPVLSISILSLSLTSYNKEETSTISSEAHFSISIF